MRKRPEWLLCSRQTNTVTLRAVFNVEDYPACQSVGRFYPRADPGFQWVITELMAENRSLMVVYLLRGSS
jgi:hypothetical protein